MRKALDAAANWLKIGKNRGLARKILIPMLAIFAFLTAIFILYSFLTSQADERARDLEKSQQAEKIFYSELQRMNDFALGLAMEAATNPEIQAAFAVRNRSKLRELTLGTYEALNESFDVPQYQYHLSPAISFLRLHSPDKFGDDLSSFRFTVLQVNETKQPVVGLEVGRGGLGLRGVQPVFYQGRHIGSVEFGLNIDETLVINLKEEYGNDWRIILTREALSLATLEDIAALQEGPTPDLLVLASTMEGTYADSETYQNALNGERFLNHVKSSENRTYSITTIPLIDYSGKTIGVVDIIFDETDAIQTQNRRLVYLVLAGLLGLGLGGANLVIATNRSLRPLQVLTEAAEAIRQGQLDQQVVVSAQDELGTLANTFNSMTAQLRDLISSLERRVAERTQALATVTEVGIATATILETDRLLQEVVDLTKERFDLYHSHIYLLDQDGKSLVLAAGAGEPGRRMVAQGHSIPLDREQSLVARAARERKGVTVNDVTQAPDFLPNPLLPDTRSELAVPMAVGNAVIGVFDIQSEQAGRFSDSDINIQTSLAAQLATSIQNVRSFEQAKTQAEFESLVNSIGQKIQGSTTVENTLQITVRELGLALGASRVKASIQSNRQNELSQESVK